MFVTVPVQLQFHNIMSDLMPLKSPFFAGVTGKRFVMYYFLLKETPNEN